ncbi:DMT family transporter [Salinibacterium hongtaonis]|uniref:EamA family transporter n=1 Tax=Homoserinimonas hongtaonis TaxID=2079791 RepID=A0A2U1SZE0_9MICO|nr:DMT family transporter [Salinibacterium hongtaonis]PWB96979.1 EamA family transporter [Salinibacterium hongtaonis]
MGYLYALLAAVLFGINGSVTRVVIEAGLTPAQLTLVRVATTAVIAAAFLLMRDRAAFKISLRQVLILALLGVTGVALLQFTYATAISLLPVGITLLIEYTAVLMVAVIAWAFFKEKVRARLWIAIALVLVGLTVVARVWDSELNAVGVAFAFAAALSLTIYFLGGEREVAKSSPMAVAFWTMTFATLFWLVFSEWWTIDPGLFTTPVSLQGNLDSVMVPVWVPLLWNMLLGSFAPFFFSLLALRYLSATAAGIVATAEVILAFFFAWVWLGEGLDTVQTIGAGLVLLGVVIAQTARQNKVVDADLAIPDAAPPSATRSR